MKNESHPVRLLCSLLLIAFLHLPRPSLGAALDPFTQAAMEDAAGRFKSEEGEMLVHLKPKEGAFTGTLFFKEQNFTLTAELKGDRIEGEFASGGKSNRFTAESDGRKMTFNTGTASYALVRQPFLFEDGIWESDRVWLRLERKNSGFAGLLKFREKAFAVTARMVADELLCMGTGGDQTFPFNVTDDAGEKGTLRFQSGAFRDAIRLRPRRCDLTVTTKPQTDFSLLANGLKISRSGSIFPVPEGHVELILQAPGFKETRTSRSFKAYEADTWEVDLVSVKIDIQRDLDHAQSLLRQIESEIEGENAKYDGEFIPVFTKLPASMPVRRAGVIFFL